MTTSATDVTTTPASTDPAGGAAAQEKVTAELVQRVAGTVERWSQGVACLAALAVATDPDTTEAAAGSALEVLGAAGVGDVLTVGARLPFSTQQLHGFAIAPLVQAADLVGGRQGGWSAYSDAALTAQGQGSGATTALFTRFVLPRAGDLAARLARPGARMLDVGTGVGGLALAFAEAFPQLHVTGLDVLPRALDLARARLGTSPHAGRIELRHQDVAALTDHACYDLAWIPAPFVPEPAFSTGVGRMVDALEPGGLLMIAHGKFDGTELETAITRFRTHAYGGTPLDADSAVRLLVGHGLTDVHTVSTPPGAPALTIGHRPAGQG